MKKNRLPAVSAISENGFVCLYFLVLFLICTTLVTIILADQQNQLRTEINVRRADELLMQEGAVLAYLKCELANERLEEGTLEEYGVSFAISKSANGLRISIFAPCPEVLDVTLDQEGTGIYDYSVIRSETAA